LVQDELLTVTRLLLLDRSDPTTASRLVTVHRLDVELVKTATSLTEKQSPPASEPPPVTVIHSTSIGTRARKAVINPPLVTINC
jgi:hypothetical protein